MTKADAVLQILRDEKRPRLSVASYTRIKRSLSALGLSPDDQKIILTRLEYYDLSGKLHPILTKAKT